MAGYKAVRLNLQEYGAPKNSDGEFGFFCRMGKAWDCLSNGSKC